MLFWETVWWYVSTALKILISYDSEIQLLRLFPEGIDSDKYLCTFIIALFVKEECKYPRMGEWILIYYGWRQDRRLIKLLKYF